MFRAYFFLLFSSLAYAKPTLFFNGNFFAEYKSHSKKGTQLLVEDGKVVQLGNNLLVPADTERVDLKGMWVFPALTDSHIHLVESGGESRKLNLKNKSLDEILALLKGKSLSGETIVGFGWDQTNFPGKAFPNRQSLDAISTSQPIILFRIDGHAAWVNTFALKQSGLWSSLDKQLEKQILKDPSGSPSGIVLDDGLKALQAIIAPADQEEIQRDIRSLVKRALSLGITSIHDAGISKSELAALKDLLRKEKIPFRFYEMLSASDKTSLEQSLKDGPEIDRFEGKLTIRTVKLYLDGAMGSRGALFSEPYSDDPKTVGLQLLSQEELETLIRKIDKSGFQVAIHAIGSKANHLAIKVLEKILGDRTRKKRPRLEHAQVLELSDIKKMGQLGIIASMQPVHCSSDSRWAIQRIGKKRARYAYAWRTVLNEKVPLAFGSDSPIEDLSPWPGVLAAIDRGLFFPEEEIARSEAFQSFTEGASYAAFQDEWLGSLSKGKWADFILLDRNPLLIAPKDLPSLSIISTYFAGKKVYEVGKELKW
jgi:predicted amidohydrolase YtcJ